MTLKHCGFGGHVQLCLKCLARRETFIEFGIVGGLSRALCEWIRLVCSVTETLGKMSAILLCGFTNKKIVSLIN